jgi:hypothetical protein
MIRDTLFEIGDIVLVLVSRSEKYVNAVIQYGKVIGIHTFFKPNQNDLKKVT